MYIDKQFNEANKVFFIDLQVKGCFHTTIKIIIIIAGNYL